MKVEYRKTLILTLLTLSFFLSSSSTFAIVLKIATVSPEGATWMVEMREGAKEIEKRTEGRVKFKFYSGGVMGSDESVLRKIKIGQLQGGAVTGGSLFNIYPDLSVYSLPFFFQSFKEVDAVREKLDPILISGLEEKGFVTFGLGEGGFAYLMSNEKLLTKEDVRRKKVWVITGDRISEALLKSADVSPIPLPISDVMTGLQTGLIDTIATSPIAAISLQWHTRVKYLTDAPISYFFGMLTVNKKSFDKISTKDQVVVREVMANTFAKINAQNRIDNERAREALVNQGIKFVELSNDILKDWKKTANNAIQTLIQEKLVNPEVYKKMQGIISSYRASQ